MLRIVADERQVTLVLSGWAMLWACRRRLVIPRPCIAAVHRREAGLRPPWCRWPGTCIPGLIIAGTYLGRGRREFWYTRRGEALVLELTGYRYTRVVVEVEDVPGTCAALCPPG